MCREAAIPVLWWAGGYRLQVELHAEAGLRGKLEVTIDRLPHLVDEPGFILFVVAVILEDREVIDAGGVVDSQGGR